jgi:hypothetical protein
LLSYLQAIYQLAQERDLEKTDDFCRK